MSDLHVVLGATGAIGSSVVAELTQRGMPVRAVSRSGAGPHGFAADIATPEGAVAACADARVVYQCAQPPYARWTSSFPAFMSTVLDAVAAARAKLVMADNLYPYGPVDGPMTEDLPWAATDPKGKVRAAVDRMILEAHGEGRLTAVLGRASDYHGPGGVNTVLGPNIFAAALSGKTMRWVGDLDQAHSVAYLPDIAAGLVTLGSEPKSEGRAWHLPCAEPLTGREFLGLVRDAAASRSRISGLGPTAQRLVGVFNRAVKELEDTRYQRDRPFVVSDSAFRQAFPAAVSTTPHTEAVAATVAWYRSVR